MFPGVVYQPRHVFQNDDLGLNSAYMFPGVGKAQRRHDQGKIDEFCIQIDEICIKNDEICIENDQGHGIDEH